MVDLGVTDATVVAWEESCRNVLALLEAHLAELPYLLGGRPSTADFGLLGPLYAHLYCDPVPGAMMRAEYPRVSQWCERVHGGADEPAVRAAWPAGDEVPATLLPLLQVVLTEMWPVLESTCRVVADYVGGDRNVKLAGKSFSADSFDQTGRGPLRHPFTLPFDAQGRPGGVSSGTRMVIPYQIWMLQRVEDTVLADGRGALRELLDRLDGGAALDGARLTALLTGCRVRKEGGLLFSA
jgi:hypothetical protein